jgi:hypothetical protein
MSEQLDLGGLMTDCPDHGTILANCIHRHSARVHDEKAGQDAKKAGMALALMPDRIADWKANFRAYVTNSRAGERMTSEDVVAVVGLPTGEVSKDANNAVGAMMNGLAKRGVIRKTSIRVPSRRRTSHGAELIVWERT